MKKEEAQTVKVGDALILNDISQTPGRKIDFPAGAVIQEVTVKRIVHEQGGYVHFDIGRVLPAGTEPLKSRDTGEEIDGSNRYWMHYSRFEKK